MRHSLFFRGMLRSDVFREGKEKVIELPADDVTAFAVFAEWLYVGSDADTGDVFVDVQAKDGDGQDDDLIGVVDSGEVGSHPNKRQNVANCEGPKTSGEATNEGRDIESRTMEEDGDENMADEGDGNVEEEDDEDGEEEDGEDGEDGEEEDGEDREEEDGEDGEEEDDEDAEEEDENTGYEHKMDWEPGSADCRARHDSYDFSLQFSCYVLADKMVAPEFKRHILDEIRLHGEFCNASDLMTDLVGYAYRNTVSKDDPLRKFCIALKCVRIPINRTLANPDFQTLMEEGGPLVRDVMEICRKRATGEKWHDQASNPNDQVFTT